VRAECGLNNKPVTPALTAFCATLKGMNASRPGDEDLTSLPAGRWSASAADHLTIAVPSIAGLYTSRRVQGEGYEINSTTVGRFVRLRAVRDTQLN